IFQVLQVIIIYGIFWFPAVISSFCGGRGGALFHIPCPAVGVLPSLLQVPQGLVTKIKGNHHQKGRFKKLKLLSHQGKFGAGIFGTETDNQERHPADQQGKGDHTPNRAGGQSEGLAAVRVVFRSLQFCWFYRKPLFVSFSRFKYFFPVLVGDSVIDVIMVDGPHKVHQKRPDPNNGRDQTHSLKEVVMLHINKKSPEYPQKYQGSSQYCRPLKKESVVRVALVGLYIALGLQLLGRNTVQESKSEQQNYSDGKTVGFTPATRYDEDDGDQCKQHHHHNL